MSRSKDSPVNSFFDDQYFGENLDSKPNNDSNHKQSVTNDQYSKEKLESASPDTNLLGDASFIDEEYFGTKKEPEDALNAAEPAPGGTDLFTSEYFQKAFQSKQMRLATQDKAEQRYEQRQEEAKLDVQRKPNLDPLERLSRELEKEDTKEESVLVTGSKGVLAPGQVPALEAALAIRNAEGINHHHSPENDFYLRYVRGLPPVRATSRRQNAPDAFEVLEKEEIEAEKMKTSDGQFVPCDITPPWEEMTNWEVTCFLKSELIYQNEDFVALNKPYGLACQSGEKNLRNIVSLLPDLSMALKTQEELLMVHRLDAKTTGALLLAKHEKAAQFLKRQFALRTVHKRYAAITVGVPPQKSGLISIPMAVVHKRSQKVTKTVLLAPDELDDNRKMALEAKAAETAYKVITSKHQASLVICEPITGYKHQVRAHLADGLNCPILGDHKYASRGDRPQRLPRGLLRQMNVRQPEVRHFMQHLHCLSMSVPKMPGGRERQSSSPETIGVYARPHMFFLKTLNRLHMSFPNFLKRMRPLL